MDVDVIIVLGARVRPDGSPSQALSRRLHHAVDLVERGAASALLLSGGAPGGGVAEAALMRSMALGRGLPEALVHVEDRSRTTLENARLCRPILAARGWSRALLVSDAWHLPRALDTFRRHGITVAGSAAPGPKPRLRLVLREAWARLVYRWRLRHL